MTRTLALAVAATLALVPLRADTQRTRPPTPIDTAAESGRRDGRAAASTPDVGGYAVLGVLTGFVAGALSLPVGAHNNSRTAGAVLFIPLGWTVLVAGKRSRAAPPPDLAARIQTQPVAYQQAFRDNYAHRLTQRRRRAALLGGVAGTVAGFLAFAGLALHAVSTAGT